MTREEMIAAARNSAEKNENKLKRLPTGRWQGKTPGPQFASELVSFLVKGNVFTVSARSEKSAAGDGYPTEVTLA